ncbi:MAG: endonuclease/exonuclease/phosphatase family protein [Pirellula sp.]
MFSFKKRHVVLVGILAGFAITYQDQLKSVWQRLAVPSFRLEKAAANAAATPTFASNSSLSDNYPTVNPYPIASDENLGRMISARTSSSIPRPAQDSSPVLRIASFNLQAFGESKLRQSAVAETIVRILRQFDVVALQHIQSKHQAVLPELVEKLNQLDRRFEYCIGPRVGSNGNQQQFAFVFDTDRIETDRQMLYTVDDPQRLVEFEPLVGWFRSKAGTLDTAFTFSLVNLRIDPLDSEREWKLIPDLIRSVRQDGRNEDDIILVGDFGGSNIEIGSLQNIGMLFALEETPTTVSGEAMLDNILFPSRATDEFTGKSGVVDFLRQGNLSIDQALQVSSHMPIWAEFFAVEGGRFGYIGDKPSR